MVEIINQRLEKIKAEELLGRFRSKEDLYKYLTIHMNLFLPSMSGTKVSFIKAILSNQKRVFKTNEIKTFNVPKYEELSIKNLYPDALKDPEVAIYLPNPDQTLNKFPERDFFFAILGTVKPDYLKKIIQESNNNRFKAEEEKQGKDYIMIDTKWLDELTKYPYFSKKPGKALYLMKQRSKIVRVRKEQTKFQLSSRLGQLNQSQSQNLLNNANVGKRRKNNEGQMEIVQPLQDLTNKAQQFNI